MTRATWDVDAPSRNPDCADLHLTIPREGTRDLLGNLGFTPGGPRLLIGQQFLAPQAPGHAPHSKAPGFYTLELSGLTASRQLGMHHFSRHTPNYTEEYPTS